MSTSDLNSLVLGEDQLLTGGSETSYPSKLPAGVIAPEVIARLANELFTSGPDSAHPPVSSFAKDLSAPPNAVPATVPAFRPEVELPSDQHFPTLPASASPTDAAPATARYQAAPPAVPGALATITDELPPHAVDFAFLQNIRPFPGVTTELPGPSHPAPQLSQHPYADPLATDLEWDVLRVPPQNTQPPSPTGSGAPLPSTPLNAAAFGFLADLRPLYSDTLAVTSVREDKDRNVPRELGLTSFPFDAETIKRGFPILRERVNGRPLIWLDNAATTQKPQSVIDRISYFYEHENSNIHRAAHELAARATDAYEGARVKVRRFVNASSTNEIIFVRGTTEGINLIANTWGRRNIGKDDEIVITCLEHHANIVPWQLLCSATGAKLRVAPVDSSGQVLLDEYEKLLGPRTKLVSFTQVSNALGTVTPAKQMIDIAHHYGATVLLDGAQSVSHMRTDVQALDCDFFVFSGHKVFGPTGIGAVYGKPQVLEHMPPWEGGGNMIQDVTFEKTTFNGPPLRFEAGTGNIADAVGLGAAIDYLDRVGIHNVAAHEHELLIHATQELQLIPGLTIIGTAKEKAGVISFILDGYKTEEVGSHLNKHGIAVRSGHHCAQPILRRFGQETTVRPSFALYNTHEDVDRLVSAVWELRQGRTSIA